MHMNAINSSVFELFYCLQAVLLYDMKHLICRGGWQADGKGASIWDTFCQEPGRVFKDQDANVSCNSYELWDEDLQCIKQLGLTHYRLSLSWPRLLPDGTLQNVNQKGYTVQLKLHFCWHFSIFSSYQLCMSCRSAILQQSN